MGFRPEHLGGCWSHWMYWGRVTGGEELEVDT